MLGRPRGPLPFSPQLLGVVVLAGAACSSVDPGGDFQIPQVVYDENFFYCQVEPQVLLAKQCGPGDPAVGDGAGSCHSSAPGGFRVVQHDAVPCTGDVPTGSVPAEATSNLKNAQPEMAIDVESAPLLTRPIGKTIHPRMIFASDSPEATLIRQWAAKRSR